MLNQIGRGKISHIFVSLFRNPDSETNMAIRAGVERTAALRHRDFAELKFDFFDAASARVWG